jgi:oligopeptide transport system substrate-binding protein
MESKVKKKKLIKLYAIIAMLSTSSCKDTLWNNPHAGDTSSNIMYSSFSAPPKTLDPAQAYSSDSYFFICQIYEPPLQYHYLNRPYQLVPLAASTNPKVINLDKDGNEITEENQQEIKYTRYEIAIKPNQFYQNHPAFSKDKNNKYIYHNLSESEVDKYEDIKDFKEQTSREVTANDFVYEIKRLASPEINSPILSVMQNHIVGLKELSQQLQKEWHPGEHLDLRKYDISGVKVQDKYHYSITLDGQYPQFMYWLAMPFFAPIPWEADLFYSQPGMSKKNLTLSWRPIGSGPYILSKNDPNRIMILRRNINFHGEKYPIIPQGISDYAAFKDLQGKDLPMIDEFRLSLEKENIPYWYKFMQGYYDRSSISSDNFDQAIQISPDGKMELTPSIKDNGITLKTSIDPSIFYIGFNMLDKTVGGKEEKTRLIRQAISIAIDYEEFINIFLNGRGVPAQSNIPPGIFGSTNDNTEFNKYLYDKDENIIHKKPISVAKEYLAKAGYPNGIDKNTGKPLTLYLDTVGSGPNAKAQANWYRKQLRKLGIDLYVMNTSWNRFQEKLRNGTTQMYTLGWNADYPDPENFLFLLYGPNGKVKHQGENVSNFSSPEFDELFARMKDLPNNEERRNIITKMTDILQKESPWVWGFFPKTFILDHSWFGPNKINPIANNSLKYQSVNGQARHQKQQQWNKPDTSIFFYIAAAILALIVPTIIKYRRKNLMNQTTKY